MSKRFINVSPFGARNSEECVIVTRTYGSRWHIGDKEFAQVARKNSVDALKC